METLLVVLLVLFLLGGGGLGVLSLAPVAARWPFRIATFVLRQRRHHDAK